MSEMETNKSNGSNNADLIERLRYANSLSFEISAGLSVCKLRTWSRQAFMVGNVSEVTGGKTVERILSVNDSYTHFDKSYLMFDVEIPGAFALAKTGVGGADYSLISNTDHISFGGGFGSALNFISEIEIKSKDSSISEHIRGADLINNIRMKYTRSQDWVENGVGSLMGVNNRDAEIWELTGSPVYTYKNSPRNLAKRLCGTAANKKATFGIPMNLLCGLGRFKKLLPSQYMGGLSVSVTFNDFNKVFRRTGQFAASDTITKYVITNLYIRLAECKLTDSMNSRLSKLSAQKGGLKIMFDTYHRETAQVQKHASINIRKNIAQALSLTVLTRDNNIINDVTESFNTAEPHDVSSYQFFHGSQPYPIQPIQSKEEAYLMTQNAFDNNREVPGDNSVGYYDYVERESVIAYNFERSSNMELSALSLSNQRTLTYEADYDDDHARTVDVWLEYTVLLSVFPGSTVVEI